jgi:CDP-2,3-bis-(O-geranylgeranyl)-sn-glycerol synthase
MFSEVAYALYFILPAYFANAAPIVFGGGRPIDNNKLFLDGKPLFGSHKTIRGFCSGLVVGTLVSFFLFIRFRYNLLLGFSLSLGALVGDLLHSFIKRRINIAPGALLPVADQLDFILGSIAFSIPVFIPSLPTILILVIITPPIHLLTNYFAYALGVKDTPW